MNSRSDLRDQSVEQIESVSNYSYIVFRVFYTRHQIKPIDYA